MSDFSQLTKLATDLHKGTTTVERRISTALRKSAFDIQAHSKALALQLFKPPPLGTSTGATANSIRVEARGPLSYAVGPTTDYAVFLEFGTSRMAPRPFMGPAADAVAPGLAQALAQIGGDVL